MLYLLICAVLVGVVTGQQISLNVGMLIPRDSDAIDTSMTFNTSAGAVTFALQKAREMQIWDPSIVNITFSWYFNQCDEALSAGYTSRLIYKNDVSAILGPVCPETSFVTGAITSFKQIPTFLWGPTAPAEFYSRDKYTTTMAFAGTAKGMFIALANIMDQFEWSECAFLYTTSSDINAVCSYFADSFTILSNKTTDINPVYIRRIVDSSPKGFHNSLETLKSRVRIIISCLETPADKRNYMLAAIDAKMTTNDYVHLFTQITSVGFGSPPFWIGNDGRDNEVRDAARTIVIMDKYLNVSQARTSLLQDIADNIFEWPFYCKNCQRNATASNLSIYLGDAMLAYLIALNSTYVKYGINQLKNTTAIMKYFSVAKPEMPSITGDTYILNPGLRSARYTLITMNSTYQGRTWATVQSAAISAIPYTPSYENENTTVWALRGGIRPVDTPKCGFSNEKCPQSPIFYTIIVVGSIILFFCIVGLLGVLIFLVQSQQRRRLNALWQIPYLCLQTVEERENSKSFRSTRTIASNNTNSSRSSNTMPRKNNTDRTGFFYFNQTIIMARHYPHTSKWTEAEEEEFRKMRQLDHENLNRFLGVAITGNTCYMIWSYNERGSLMEVIKAHAFRIDNFIMVGMIRNIVEGINYIHNSSFQQHGSLSVYRCVVGDRFEVKIQCYGLHGIKQRTVRTLNENTALFVAPEHLHGQQNVIGSQSGDIYSLGIVCSVILTLKPAYNCAENDDEQAGEIVRSVARGKYPPVRPELEIAPEIEINHELLSLIKKMWSEHPPERPTIEDIREAMIKRISTNKKSNLMDYMFGLMEGTAAELEQDVQQRTLELLEEQKKADILLYRMMPREAADNLKLGQTVAPEVYESATVFFSDIVSFTVLASKSTPLQIISFLNDVYTLTDSVIERYDVYKVETIGDGMHVVSGVPRRNGNNHVKEIADMAIDFQRTVKTLRMSHLPDHQIQMRVGITSGPAVAGIVGLTSPRYIVFGDTVNVAAKMEASGRAGRIHISSATKSLLQTHFPNQYTILDRGETLIKGIGSMHTAWIVPPEEILSFQP